MVTIAVPGVSLRPFILRQAQDERARELGADERPWELRPDERLREVQLDGGLWGLRPGGRFLRLQSDATEARGAAR